MADFTQAHLDLNTERFAKAAGVAGVTSEDQTVTMQGADDQIKLRAVIQRDVNPPLTHRFAVTSKGV